MFLFFIEEIIKRHLLTLKEHPALSVKKETLAKTISAVSKKETKIETDYLESRVSINCIIF